jgi:hypothetical protein
MALELGVYGGSACVCFADYQHGADDEKHSCVADSRSKALGVVFQYPD